MKTYTLLFIFLICFSISRAEQDYSSVLSKQNQLQFMKNQGQFDPAIAYKSSVGNIRLAFLQNHDISYCISREIEGLEEEKTDSLADFLREREKEKLKAKEYLTWNQTWLNSNKNAKVYELNHSKSKCNYFIGNDSSKWVKNADQYAELKYENIYTNIDAHYYSKEGKFKYDYIVKPGGKAADIKVSYQGIQKLSINAQGQLIIHTDWGDFTEETPYSYIQETKQEVPVQYALLNDSTFMFQAPTYTKNQTLIIDPYSLCWSTFLGGATGYYSTDIEVSSNRELFVAGYCDNTHPISTGIFQPVYGGGSADVFVSKLSSDGTSLIFSTFLGGNMYEVPRFLEVLQNGSIVITGWTKSLNYPTSIGAIQSNFNGGFMDLFVSKLSLDGANLLFSSFIGGSDYEEPWAININSIDEVIIAGFTGSFDFPVTSGSFQTNFGGIDDVFIFRLNTNSNTLIFSSFLGGIGQESIENMLSDLTGDIILSGVTSSSNFPTTVGSFQAGFNGVYDLYVSKISADGTLLLKSTLLGGTGQEHSVFMQINSASEIILTGRTSSANFSVTPGVFQSTYAGFGDIYACKLSNDLSNLLFSTYLGGTDWDFINSMTLDLSENILITGFTDSQNYPISIGAFQTTYGGNRDAIVSKLNTDGTNLIFSTYIGGSNSDLGNTCINTSTGGTLVVGLTRSANFPTISGAFQTLYGGLGYDDLFVCELNNNGSNLSYSTFLGGDNADYGYNNNKLVGCNLYMSPTVHSMNFPVTPGAFQTIKPHTEDTPVVLKISMCEDVDSDLLNDSSNCTINQIHFPAPIEGGVWSDGSMVDTFFVNAPGQYWFEADSGCGMMYRDSFEVSIGSVQSFAIADTAVCVDALIDAPVAGGTWFDGSTNPNISIDQAGDYWFEYYDATCDTTLRDSFAVVIHQKQDFDIPDTSACDELALSVPIAGGVWSNGTNVNPLLINQEGPYWYEYTDTCAFTHRDSFQVSLGSLKTQDLQNLKICQGKIEAIIPTVPGGVWSDGSTDGFYSVSAAGDYWYVFDNGCGENIKDEFTVSQINCDTIVCKPPYFYIPNTFTPDVNNLNEDYGPSLGNCIEYFELVIYDRWGEQLFITNNPNERWNARYQNVLVKQDVYVWKMSYKLINTRDFVEYGHVTVLR